MMIVEKMRGLFAQEFFVHKTKQGEYRSLSRWWVLGKFFRWIQPSQYFDISTIWKAHSEVNSLLSATSLASAQLHQTITKLQSLRAAVQPLSKEKNEKFDALLARIDASVAILSPQRKEDSPSPAQVAHDVIEALVGNKAPSGDFLCALIKECSIPGKKEVERIVVEQLFEPLLIHASSILTRPGLDPSLYYEAVQSVKKYYEPIARVFGGEEVVKVLEKYQFHESVKNSFLFPFCKKWLGAYWRGNKDVVDTLHMLQKYKNAVKDMPFDWLQNDQSWNELQEKFREIFLSFFSRKVSLSFSRSTALLDRPVRLSEAYEEPSKEKINSWLAFIQDGENLLKTYARQLTYGVYVGEQNITAESLHIPPEIEGRDREILLCWGLYQEIISYYKTQGVKEPEKKASLLMTFSTLDYASCEFFSSLGMFADCPIVALPREQCEPGQRIGVSFSAQGKSPIAHWVQGFHRPQSEQDPGFFVRAAIQLSGKNAFSEEVEITPGVFTGYGFHIEESKGRYELFPDSTWSYMRKAFGSKKIYPFSREGTLLFGRRLEKHLARTEEATFLSLRHMERDIRDLSLRKKIQFPKDSHVRNVLDKVEALKKDLFGPYETVFGRSLAQELVHTYEKTDISFHEFLQLLDKEIAEIQTRNRSSVKILEGLFSELKVQCPDHHESIEQKAVESIWGDLTNPFSNSPRNKYDIFMTCLTALKTIFQERSVEILEKIYVKIGAPLLAASMKEEMKVPQFEDTGFQKLEDDIRAVKDMFPLPHERLFDALFSSFKEGDAEDRGNEILFWLGSEIGRHSLNPLVRAFEDIEKWFSLIVSGEKACQISEGLRWGCGEKYGIALSELIPDLDGLAFYELESKEKTSAPLMYSHVVRGMFLGIDDHFAQEREHELFCAKYADLLIRHFDERPLDNWFKGYFKPMLAVPSCLTNSMILQNFMKKMCETHSETALRPFFDALPEYVVQEVTMTASESLPAEKKRQYFDNLFQLSFPEKYKDVIKAALVRQELEEGRGVRK